MIARSDLYGLYNYKYLSIDIIKELSEVIPSFNHFHSEYEFIIPLMPISYLLINNTIYYGEYGKVYPIQSGTVHGLTQDLNHAAYINMKIDKSFFEETIANIICPNGICFNYEFDITPRLFVLINLFKEETLRLYPCNDFLMHIASLICIELSFNGLMTQKNQRIPDKYPPLHTVKEIFDYIISNHAKDLSIDDLSSICNLSRYHFIRTFKKCFGNSPYNFIINIRLSIAKMLLVNTDLSITEISMQSGFLSPNRFAEVFRQKNNITPSKYRKTFKNIGLTSHLSSN
ncbi:MAG: AraC family transcriptional regulator [Bacilli bacterium]|nr:AraC family transcriptional regulator [Bacilli bacterium]MDD4076628.1 AraC family transcriptional regulator [Bacilli bacterium]MDD4388169.1 AraC family transcriptional regulator [Bacilli bacterium]